MNKSNKVFERNVCFTFFEDYRLTAKELEDDFGKEIVADYYNAIIDYALYEQEPELKGTIKYVWHTTKTTIDKSVERRSNAFGKADVETTKKILQYKENHPEATQRKIAEAVGCSPGKVNKVLKDYSSNTYSNSNTDTNSSSNTCNEREREHVSLSSDEGKPSLDVANAPDDATHLSEREDRKKRTLKDLTKEELNGLLDDFRAGKDEGFTYPVLQQKYNLTNGQLDKKLPDTINSIFKDREKEDKLVEFKEFLTEETKQELCKLLNAENDEEFFELISGLTVKIFPDELLSYLEENELFIYKVWIKDYAYQEYYREMTYYDWFTTGVNHNYGKTYSWDY